MLYLLSHSSVLSFCVHFLREGRALVWLLFILTKVVLYRLSHNSIGLNWVFVRHISLRDSLISILYMIAVVNLFIAHFLLRCAQIFLLCGVMRFLGICCIRIAE